MGRQKQPAYISEQKPFPTRLRELMAATDTTQSTLAKAIGMTRQGVALYTSGQTTPDIDTFVKIAEFFGVSFDYLLGYSDAKHRENSNIVEETGLSEKAIEKLKTWVEEVKEPDANGVQVTRIVNTKAPEEISLLLESNHLRTLVSRLRALRHLAGEEVAAKFYPGPAKAQVLRDEFGTRDAWEYVLFQAVNTFQEMVRDIAPAPDYETRKATQADMDDF